ncbi:MAG: hypothetical protein IPM23_01595 [Candidatus Melainabacteria bacterium]|nr:hypothetical protein [Candidatus Melainabacteria bacterium]
MNESNDFCLQYMLCQKARASVKALSDTNREFTATIAEYTETLNKAIDAKLAYLDGRILASDLEKHRMSAEIVRDAARDICRTGAPPDRIQHLAKALRYSAEAAVCAVSVNMAPPVDDPEIEAMLDDFLLNGR